MTAPLVITLDVAQKVLASITDIENVLIEMNVPGVQWLSLTETIFT